MEFDAGLVAIVCGAVGVLALLLSMRGGGQKKRGTASAAEGGVPAKLTWEEVRKHNTADDCWLVIRDKQDVLRVYDVTSYVDSHPGGDAIFRKAGTDVTKGFYGAQHGETVFDLVQSYEIGKLVEE